MAQIYKLTDRATVDDSPTRLADSESWNATERDQAILLRLGKKPILKRNFGFLSILGFSSTTLVCWESTLILLDIALENGGPAGAVYGYILVWIGSLAIFTSLSELASMAPTSGGQYHWVSMLAPRSVHKFASYTEGWLTVIGWQALCAGAGYLSANLIQGLASLTHPNYHPHPYQVTLLLWAVIVLSVFINAIGGTFLPKFEGLILILHCLGYFAILLPLVVLGEHQNSSQVFDVFLNGGNWPTEGLSFMIGLTGSIFVFVGADGAIHMSEEIVNAAVIVPRSIVFSYTYNGILGFGILLTALFCRGDLDTVLNPPSGYAFIEIFLQATESTTGAAVMTCIITVMQLAASISILTSSSRMLWSFARDHGVPGWRILSKVHQRSTVPIWCVAVTSLISCLLSLINLGSPTAFNDVVSISVAGLYSSYLVALGLLLYRRCTGGIKFSNTSDDSLTNTSGAELTWGPWYLPGAFGIVVNAFACVYLTTALFFTFWPTELPVKADNMNYSVLVLGTVILFSTIHYIFWGKKEYTGPLVEVSRSRG